MSLCNYLDVKYSIHINLKLLTDFKISCFLTFFQCSWPDCYLCNISQERRNSSIFDSLHLGDLAPRLGATALSMCK